MDVFFFTCGFVAGALVATGCAAVGIVWAIRSSLPRGR